MSIILDDLKRYITAPIPEHFKIAEGVEAYSYYINQSFALPKDSKIADLGTLQGLSALALSANPEIKVVSYDIDLSKNIVKKGNIEFVEANCFDKIDDILECSLVLVDIDPHDGVQESDFLDLLIEKNYKGVTLWDDIHLNAGMKAFWSYANELASDKLIITDVSKQGHHSGTGRIEFI